jgi:hypothetical protein
VIPIAAHHPYYCSDEIEIWEVRAVGNNNIRNDSVIPVQFGMLTWGDDLDIVEATQMGRTLTIHQQRGSVGGGMGATLWPSSVVLSRFVTIYIWSSKVW